MSEPLSTGSEPEDRPDGYVPHRFPVSIKGVVTWDEKVLLAFNERSEWELPGGRLEPDGETPEQCVEREILEETGIVATADQILDVWIHHVLPGRQVVVITFGCTPVADQLMDPALSHEHTAVDFIPLDQLDGIAIPNGYVQSIRRWLAHAE